MKEFFYDMVTFNDARKGAYVFRHGATSFILFGCYVTKIVIQLQEIWPVKFVDWTKTQIIIGDRRSKKKQIQSSNHEKKHKRAILS
jgi:hypothetical protein